MYLLTLALLCQLPPAMPPLPVSSETRAAQAVQPDAPAVVARPAGVFETSPPRHQLSSPQCAGGACGAELRPRVSGHKGVASEPRRFSFQAQPVRRFLFRRR